MTDEAGHSGSYPALWLWKRTIRSTRGPGLLASSHLDHDPTNNRPSNLKAFSLPHGLAPPGGASEFSDEIPL